MTASGNQIPLVGRLCLGTAQMGFDYGSVVKVSRISENESHKIFNVAQEYGIDMLDTASGYGISEQLIGRYAAKDNKSFKIVSKCAPCSLSSEKYLACLETSLSRIAVKALYGYVVHATQTEHFDQNLWDALRRFKEAGHCAKIGFSLYRPSELENILQRKISFDLLQVPYNVLDRRFEPYFPDLAKKNIEIHVRSAYLQGVLFLESGRLPPFLKSLTPILEKLQALSQQEKIERGALLLNFTLANKYVCKTVIGIATLKQISDALSFLLKHDQVLNLREKLQGLSVSNENILIPYLWPAIPS